MEWHSLIIAKEMLMKKEKDDIEPRFTLLKEPYKQKVSNDGKPELAWLKKNLLVYEDNNLAKSKRN